MNLEGEITVDIAYKPRSISFGQIGKGEKAKRDFSLTVTEPAKIKITSVTIEDEKFEVTRKSGNPTGNAEYVLNFKGSDTLGRISAKVHVTYEGSEIPSLDIPVRLNVVGNLRYSKNIYFLKRDDKFKAREVVITTRSGNPVKIKSVKDPDKLLKLSIVEREGQRVIVKAEVADPNKDYKDPGRHIFKINTTDTDEPVVEVGYVINSRRKPKRLSPLGANKMLNPFMKSKTKPAKGM